MDRKFGVYKSLSEALRRAKVLNYGSVASLLLETFLEDNGRLPASKAVARGLCKEGEFWLWRKMLVEKGWLVWSESQQDKGHYSQGKKLVPYINKEKLASKEIVTRDEVLLKRDAATREEQAATRAELEDVKKKLDATEARISTMEKRMAQVYKKLKLGETDPPGYEKLQAHLAEELN